MPRITRVKKAQQRFRMVPVIKDGAPVTVPVTKRDGSPKLKKNGTAITRRLTVADPTQPLPNRTCGKCHQEIKVGDPYLWWANRSPGMRGGMKRYRCAKPECYPKPWETEGNPKRAALMQAEAEAEQALSAEFSDAADLESIMSDFASTVRDIAQEFIDSADNIESGFGTATYQSDELRERGENLESAADELESVDFEDPPERDDFTGEMVCPECGGSGVDDESEAEDPDDRACSKCKGEGEIEDEETAEHEYEEALDQWREEQREKASEAMSEVEL